VRWKHRFTTTKLKSLAPCSRTPRSHLAARFSRRMVRPSALRSQMAPPNQLTCPPRSPLRLVPYPKISSRCVTTSMQAWSRSHCSHTTQMHSGADYLNQLWSCHTRIPHRLLSEIDLLTTRDSLFQQTRTHTKSQKPCRPATQELSRRKLLEESICNNCETKKYNVYQ